MKSLEELNVSNCKDLTDDCVRLICDSANFSSLKVLRLSGIASLTPFTIDLIGTSKILRHLDALYLSGCTGITKDSLLLTKKSPNFQKLKILEIDESHYSILLIR